MERAILLAGAAALLSLGVVPVAAQDAAEAGEADYTAQQATEGRSPFALVDPPQPQPESLPVVASLIERAIEMIGANDNAGAIAELDAALAIDSEDVWAWSNRGMALAMLRRDEEAIEAFDRADAIAPDNPVALRGRGYVLLMRDQDFGEAAALLGRSLLAEPDDAFAHYYRGVAFAGRGNAEAALADFTRAKELAPFWMLPYMAIVGHLASLERTEDAVTAVDTMIAAFPDDPTVQAAASELMMGLRQYDRADELQAQSLENGETPMGLLNSARRREFYETEIKLQELNRALEMQPDFIPALYERADTLWAEYRLSEALRDADRMIELMPEFLPGYSVRGLILYDLERESEMARMAAQLAEEFPDNPDALALAISLYRQVNYRTRAGELRGRLEEIAPDHPVLQSPDTRFLLSN